MRGEGELAELVSRFFQIAKRRAGLDRGGHELAVHRFRRQGADQLELFGEG